MIRPSRRSSCYDCDYLEGIKKKIPGDESTEYLACKLHGEISLEVLQGTKVCNDQSEQ